MKHEFVEFIPDHLEAGVLYISLKYGTAFHKCCCGCGKDVVTPLSPTDWKLIFDGKAVSLYPSIGNWSFECKSHYWIENGKVEWAELMSDDLIEAGRRHDRLRKERYYSQNQVPSRNGVEKSGSGFWRRMFKNDKDE